MKDDQDERPTIGDLIQIQLAALRESLETRSEYFQAQLDRSFNGLQTQIDQRFTSEQLATRTALKAADTAVQAALTSAEKAVSKAEIASEKRFESVNEFRAQLTDQAATFVNRQEAEVRISSLAEKLDTETKRNSTRIGELELRVNSRLDILAGAAVGSAERRTESRLDTGTVIQFASVIVAIAAVLFALIHH